MTISDPPQTPRPVRAAADEPVEVRLTVNGTPVALRLPARVTLADALRDQLGLTGTHVGCEHGVCGMCTVLVDGQAARSCLLFACQLDGSEVVTVEGLGRQNDLHPLQEAFGRNHALQCGFCTPGFLLSAYDLLTTKPDVAEEELPQELSGVLCRCTGYRNILTAVAETQRVHPEGIPAPGNCAPRALAGRAGTGSAIVPETAGTPADPTPAVRELEVSLPQGEPTLTVDVTTHLDVAVDRVWTVLDDIPLLARCLPGAELTERLDDEHYAGRARVAVGPIKLSFSGLARILERDRETGTLRVLAQGQDSGGARTHVAITLTTRSTDSGTELRADADVYLTGRIAQFGRALAGDISRRMFEDFADSLRQAAVSGHAPDTQAAAPSALRLLLSSLADRIRAALRRAGRRGDG